jgi:hypothetical protein
MKKKLQVAVVKSPFFGLLLSVLFGCQLSVFSQGCTDPLAINYAINATVNDGSCIYSSATISPEISWELPPCLQETSGLIEWNGLFWSHNDNNDASLFSIDTFSILTPDTLVLNGLTTIDWEEITQDNDYFYLGDFGNNASGNRTDLRIFRVLKSSVGSSMPVIDTIQFSYEDQLNYTPTSPNSTNFDCEAFIVTNDSVFLFTKQWLDQKTTLYSLPKIPGSFIANKIQTFDCDGLVTGACLIPQSDLVIISGYSQFLQPFIWLLYDFQGANFFSANKRKIGIDLPFHQIEAIHSTNGTDVVMTNERFQQSTLVFPQRIHTFDFSSYLENYLVAGFKTEEALRDIHIFPNPTLGDFFSVLSSPVHFPIDVRITDNFGRQVGSVTRIESVECNLTSPKDSGMYLVNLTTATGQNVTFRLMKQ